jgi:hypothetical protein
MTFACITPALIVGAFAERVKFTPLIIFVVAWLTLAYFPIAHMVWYWAGPDFLHAAPTTAAAMGLGRAGLRGRNGGAHQRRHRRADRLPRDRPAHRLQERADAAA